MSSYPDKYYSTQYNLFLLDGRYSSDTGLVESDVEDGLVCFLQCILPAQLALARRLLSLPHATQEFHRSASSATPSGVDLAAIAKVDNLFGHRLHIRLHSPDVTGAAT